MIVSAPPIESVSADEYASRSETNPFVYSSPGEHEMPLAYIVGHSSPEHELDAAAGCSQSSPEQCSGSAHEAVFSSYESYSSPDHPEIAAGGNAAQTLPSYYDRQYEGAFDGLLAGIGGGEGSLITWARAH
jgi:hypothetical protein